MFLMRAGIDTYQEPVVYMNADCAVCRSEGFAAQTRVWVEAGNRRIIATLNVVTEGNWLPQNFAALSDGGAGAAWLSQPNETVTFSHADAPESARLIRSKVYGEKLDRDGYRLIMRDAIDGALADVELASFLAACASRPMSSAEIAQLTLAMVDAGERVQCALERRTRQALRRRAPGKPNHADRGGDRRRVRRRDPQDFFAWR